MIRIEHLLGKRCELVFMVNLKPLHFKAMIDAVDETHIYFTDKFNNKYGFRRSDLAEIKELIDDK